jgi:hypothetical protein
VIGLIWQLLWALLPFTLVVDQVHQLRTTSGCTPAWLAAVYLAGEVAGACGMGAVGLAVAALWWSIAAALEVALAAGVVFRAQLPERRRTP